MLLLLFNIISAFSAFSIKSIFIYVFNLSVEKAERWPTPSLRVHGFNSKCLSHLTPLGMHRETVQRHGWMKIMGMQKIDQVMG